MINRGSAALRTLVLGTLVATGAVNAPGIASANSLSQQWINATGTIAPPQLQAFTASSSGTSPAHVALTVTQSSALGFIIKSVFSDSTSGATLASNTATTNDANENTIAWLNEDGDVYTGAFDYLIQGSFVVTDTVTDSNGATATAEVTVTTLGSAYSAVTPTRILDTRNGTGASKSKVGAKSIVKLRVEGAGPIPSSGVTAAVLNVTVVATTGDGYITVYPSGGTTVPTVSSLDYSAGKAVPNLVTMPVGSDGYVYLYNGGSAPVDLIADVSGYYSLSGASLYAPAIPERVLDTRNGTGAPKGAVQAGGTVRVLVALGNTFLAPPGDMSAVAVNITVVNPSSGGYVTAYADGTSKPGTSNLDFTTGQTVANSAIVPVAANGEIDLTTTATANLLVDVVGYYSTSPSYADAAFVPISPSRVFDSRKAGNGQLENGIEYDLNLGPWAQSTVAIQMNATVTNTKSSGYLSLYTYGNALPGTSNLDWTAGQTVANAASVTANGSNQWMAIYNGGSAGIDVILDVSGYFEDSRV